MWDILNSIPNSGDNFFKSATYTIEIVCAESFPTEKEKLQSVEAKILTKRAELSKFETEYREVCAHLSLQLFSIRFFLCTSAWQGYILKQHNLQVLAKFTEMTSKYTQEMQTVCLVLML